MSSGKVDNPMTSGPGGFEEVAASSWDINRYVPGGAAGFEYPVGGNQRLLGTQCDREELGLTRVKSKAKYKR